MRTDLNIDDFVDYETEYRKHVKKAVVAGNGMTGLCPFHDDRQNSFSVDLKTGKWHCFSEEIGGNFLDFYARIHGTDTKEAYKEILKQYGRDESEPEDRSYTLSRYASDKHLPVEWLESFCRLSTGKERRSGTEYLVIPYFDRDGRETVQRRRYAHKEFRWRHGARGKIGLYGEWRLPAMGAGDPVILVEGESDSQSLWYMGFPALGVPGASMFKAEHAGLLDGFSVYLHQEKDGGGRTFAEKTRAGLLKGGFSGTFHVFSCGDVDGCKDPSDILVKYGRDKGRAIIGKLLEESPEADIREPEQIPRAIEGAPVDLRIPAGWNYDEAGIYRVDPKSFEERIVCGTPIIPTRRIASLDSDGEKIEIAFLKRGMGGRQAWQRAILPRSTVFTTKGAGALSDLGCMVTSENVKDVIRFLSALEAANDDLIARAESTSTFGWQPGGRFVPGASEGIVLDIDSAQGAIAAAYHKKGTFAAWKAAMQAHRDGNRFRFILAAAFAAPLLKPLNQRTFFVYNWGDARGGKTAALKAALSVWGEPDGLMMNFNTTQVGLERTAAFFSDLPLGVDERQAAGTGAYGQSRIENLVYMICEGKGKTRGARDGGVQKVNRWRTVALATGEEPLTSGTSQTGVFSRVVELYQGPFAGEAEAAAMHQAASSDFGHAGPEFVRMLRGADPEALKRAYARMTGFVRSVGKGKAGSHVNSVALIALADALADTWIFSETPEGQMELPDGLGISAASWNKACAMAEEVMQEQMGAAEGDVNENATQFLVDWVASNHAFFGDDTVGACYGMMGADGKVAYIYASVLNQALSRAGFNEKKTKKYLADKGYITAVPRQSGDGYTYSVTKRFGGRVQRFIEFFYEKAAGLEEDGDGGFVQADENDELPFD